MHTHTTLNHVADLYTACTSEHALAAHAYYTAIPSASVSYAVLTSRTHAYIHAILSSIRGTRCSIEHLLRAGTWHFLSGDVHLRAFLIEYMPHEFLIPTLGLISCRGLHWAIAVSIVPYSRLLANTGRNVHCIKYKLKEFQHCV